MITIACPECGEEMKIFLMESAYEGPLRCAKCRGLFWVVIRGEKLESWKPLTEEELKAAQEAEALKAKFKRGSGGD
jgi:uncharacterized Zn finger protein